MAALDELWEHLSKYRQLHRDAPARIALGSFVLDAVLGDARARDALGGTPVRGREFLLFGLPTGEDEFLHSHAFEIRGPVLAGSLDASRGPW